MNYEFETGFSLRNEGDYLTYGSYAHYLTADTESHHLYFKKRLSQYGMVHVHPLNATLNKWIPMISLDDIYTVLDFRNTYISSPMNNTHNPNGDALFVSILVAQQAGITQTYAIKIDDITKFQKLQAIKNNKSDWAELNKELEEDYINDANDLEGTPAQYQKTLLKFIKKYDLSVSLYQMQQINVGTPEVEETWTKLSLGLTENINQTPCGE